MDDVGKKRHKNEKRLRVLKEEEIGNIKEMQKENIILLQANAL
jgi:hypothetical protein